MFQEQRIYIFPLKRHKSLGYFHSLSFIILSLLLGTANTQHKCDLIFIFSFTLVPSLHCIVSPFFLPSLRLRCPDTSTRCAISSYNVLCFFLFEEVVKVITCTLLFEGCETSCRMQICALGMKIDMRLSATILIKSDEIDAGIFLYIFIATLSLWASHSLHPRNRLVMCCRQSRCVKRRNIVIQTEWREMIDSFSLTLVVVCYLVN